MRKVVPPSQLAEHSAQALHKPHFPSWQALSPQGCVLQARISILSLGSQRSPPASGMWSTNRFLSWWPPPQLQLHGAQLSQVFHTQSRRGHACAPWQALTSPRWPSKPRPPRDRSFKTLRSRLSSPGPQVKEQLLQSVQSLTSAFHVGHGASMQPRVSMSSAGHSWPPNWEKRSICRWRLVWPSPQVRSQGPKVVHSDMRQSTFTKPQDCP
mmetsp:Transcript_130679/g.310003  ORF Transcript_130679/g.310003 Transcript_130679/m.310003 type:complete len:211 (-) Transcript_130679:1691-2323(-)